MAGVEGEGTGGVRKAGFGEDSNQQGFERRCGDMLRHRFVLESISVLAWLPRCALSWSSLRFEHRWLSEFARTKTGGGHG